MKKLKESSFLIKNKNKLKKIVSILSKEYEYVSILGVDVQAMSYRYGSMGAAIVPNKDNDRGFVLRVRVNKGYSEYSFNDCDVESVCHKIREVANEDRKAYLSLSKELTYDNIQKDEKTSIYYIGEVKENPLEVSSKSIMDKLQSAYDKSKNDYDTVVSINMQYSFAQVNKIFISNNKDLYQSYAYSTFACFASARKGDRVESDYMVDSGLCGMELLDNCDSLAKEVCKRADELLGAEKIIPGTYDIVCDPDFTGLIAHEAFGHGAEMDMFVKKRAKGEEFVNKEVASDKVTMHDGAAAAENVSSYIFDDEGNKATDTVIIEDGILRTGMCDELSALLLNTEPTGNGKRESYKRKAYTRMTNTFFDEGEYEVSDLISSVESGYLLEGLHSGMEDPKNWGIQCVAIKGREIKNGKLTGKIVSPVCLTGYVPDLLKSISMVSKGLILSGSGYCGKGWKEWVKTSTGGAYIKAKGRLS